MGAVSMLGKLQSVGLGVIAAVVTVLLLDRWRDEPKLSKAETLQAPGEGTTRIVRNVVLDHGAHDRIQQLELQLRDMQAKQAASEQDVGHAELGSEDAVRMIEESYAELDRVHEGDSRDSQWADTATTTLTSGLTALGEKIGFIVGEADCRTTTCKAKVTWKDYATARGSFSQLAEQLFGGLNCEQHVRLGEPGAPDAPSESVLYLDCTDLRARTLAGASLN